MRPPYCTVCGHECIPMADYDLPTCVACDQAVADVMARSHLAPMLEGYLQPGRELLAEAARLEAARVYGNVYGAVEPIDLDAAAPANVTPIAAARSRRTA